MSLASSVQDVLQTLEDMGIRCDSDVLQDEARGTSHGHVMFGHEQRTGDQVAIKILPIAKRTLWERYQGALRELRAKPCAAGARRVLEISAELQDAFRDRHNSAYVEPAVQAALSAQWRGFPSTHGACFATHKGMPVVLCIMERLTGGDLHEFVRKHIRPGDVAKKALLCLFGHVLVSLAKASSVMDLCHNDLHLSNVMLRVHPAEAAGSDADRCIRVRLPDKSSTLCFPFPHGCEAVVIDFGRCSLSDPASQTRVVSSEIRHFQSRWNIWDREARVDATVLLLLLMRYVPRTSHLLSEVATELGVWQDEGEQLAVTSCYARALPKPHSAAVCPACECDSLVTQTIRALRRRRRTLVSPWQLLRSRLFRDFVVTS